MKHLALIISLLLPLSSVARQAAVSSPDGTLTVAVSDDNGLLTYTVALDGAEVVMPSRLGFAADFGNFLQGLQITRSTPGEADRHYQMRQVKQSHIHYCARLLDVEVENAQGQRMTVQFSVTDRDVNITSMTAFPMSGKVTGLAVATYGNGISVSADTGKTWTPILNRAKLSDNLGSVRMVPSVIVAGSESLVSYKVSKDSKITIEVFSYDMKKVRKIVKAAPRSADASRSTNAKEDVWDGKDDYGRPCTMGVYYVRVKDNHGHVGWGKVMTLGGHK